MIAHVLTMTKGRTQLISWTTTDFMNQRSTVKVKLGSWILQLFCAINDINSIFFFTNNNYVTSHLLRMIWDSEEGPYMIFGLRGKGKISNLEVEFAQCSHHNSIHWRYTMTIAIFRTYIAGDQKRSLLILTS